MSATPPAEPKKEPTRAEAKAIIKEMTDKLNKMDNQRHGGAGPRLPKARMLDARELEKANPDKHYLYVNTDDPGNLQSHLDEGYRAVGSEETRKHNVRDKVGELVLMEIPRAEFEDRVERQKEMAQSRLEQAHKAEFRHEVEGIVRELKERGYKDHDIRRILVDE